MIWLKGMAAKNEALYGKLASFSKDHQYGLNVVSKRLKVFLRNYYVGFLLIFPILVNSNASIAADCDDCKCDTCEWMELLKQDKPDEAKTMCQSLIESEQVKDKVSAYKCFANLALFGNDVITMEGNELGGGSMKPGWKPEALEKAVAYLTKAIELTPKEVAIHDARIQLLLNSSKYSKAMDIIDDSLKVLNEKPHLEYWLDLTGYFFNSGQFSMGILYTKKLVSVFGDDHRLHANLGGMYAMQKDDENAIASLNKAIEINPNSPLNTWNLARIYDYNNQLDKANALYSKALSLKAGPFDTDLYDQATCLYSEFLSKKMKDNVKACEYKKPFCTIDYLVCE